MTKIEEGGTIPAMLRNSCKHNPSLQLRVLGAGTHMRSTQAGSARLW